MWETYGWKYDDLLWPGTAFRGGIAGFQEGPCGAVSGMALVTGLRHRGSATGKAQTEKEQKAACEETAALVKCFKDKYGAITCIELIGVDFKDAKAVAEARAAGKLDNICLTQVQYAIEKLYELEEKRP